MPERIDSTALSVNNVLPTKLDSSSLRFESNMRALADLVAQVRNEEEIIREGGGAKAIENQHAKNRLTARERIKLLTDPGTFFELGLYAAHGMYEEWGGAPAAGVITGMARVQTRLVMIIANDATVKAGAFFPMTSKKVIRAQNIAIENRIPTIYLVDSAGVFLMAMFCARITFFDVIGKNAPAFTVASLAMIITSRVCTRAMPVITPAAGAPPHSSYMPCAAYRPSSKNVPGSVSSSMRSRAVRRPLL